MKSNWRTGTLLTAVALSCATAWGQANQFGSPLLPIPAGNSAITTYSTPTYRGTATNLGGPMPAIPAAADPGAPPVEAVQPAPFADAWADDATCDTCDGGCGDCCCENCGCCWFGSISAITLTRNNPNRLWTTYETNNNPNQLLNTKDADADWGTGGEVTVGYWWGGCGCTRTGLALSYFTVDPMEGFASVNQADVADTVSTTLDFVNGNVTIGGVPASDFFDDAEEQRIYRSDEIHNVELNWLCQTYNCNSCCQVTWLVGARFFRFDEYLSFGSVDAGFNFGDNGGANEAYLDVRAENNLVGAQIGVIVDYAMTDRFSAFIVPKIGIYGNEINTRSRLYDGTGVEGFDITGSKTDFSMLAQIDLGLSYEICCNWRLFGGYRAMAVTGVALSDNQIPFYLAAADEFADPDSNGSLILHGAYTGLEYRF